MGTLRGQLLHAEGAGAGEGCESDRVGRVPEPAEAKQCWGGAAKGEGGERAEESKEYGIPQS